MRRSFNTTGPCNPSRHYMLPAEERLPDLLTYVEQELYFVIHAARQTGKTTAMIAFAKRLRSLGNAAVYVTIEASRVYPDVARAEAIWVYTLFEAAREQLPPSQQPVRPTSGTYPEGSWLRAMLTQWSHALGDVPLILLIDEADVVTGDAMVNLLSQLRAGFSNRGAGQFPTSVALVGMRDLRDYLAQAKGGVPASPGSPFNVKKASLTLRNFTAEEVGRLYAQHTTETGQAFTAEAVERAFYWTQGQPFLVNALADQCVGYARQLDDPRIEGTVTADHIDAAKEKLILARTTHLDSLGNKLREPRVAPILQAVLLGDDDIDYDTDDFQYVVDLGLLMRVPRGGAEVSNPLYREVLVRQLSFNVQMNLPEPQWRWRTPEGGLDMPALMTEFQSWWAEHAEILRSRAKPGYPEAVAQLAFMGFLQRVVNGGGRVTREYGAGRHRIDLLVEYGGFRYAIELKRVRPRDGADSVRAVGLKQLGGYLDTLGLTEGWLLIFDQRPRLGWKQRIWREDAVVDGRSVHLVGA